MKSDTVEDRTKGKLSTKTCRPNLIVLVRNGLGKMWKSSCRVREWLIRGQGWSYYGSDQGRKKTAEGFRARLAAKTD